MARRPIRIPIPFIHNPIAPGSAIARITTAVGIRPCQSCKERAQSMDKRLVFVPFTSVDTEPKK